MLSGVFKDLETPLEKFRLWVATRYTSVKKHLPMGDYFPDSNNNFHAYSTDDFAFT